MTAEASIKAHEGYREYPYRDHLSFWTVAHGILIQRMPIPSYTRTVGEVLDHITDPHMHERWFAERFANAQREARTFAGESWERLSQPRQDVLVELAYWIGYPKLSGFKRFRAALKAEQWVKAEAELLDSRLHEQVPGRTSELAAKFLEG